MFKVGDKVLYGSDGVCKIIDITEKSFNDVSAMFYVLEPIFSNSSTFFVPTENEKLTSKMKYILSLDELEKITEKKPPKSQWQTNDLLRKENFKMVISGGSIEDIVSVLRLIAEHKKEIEPMGKKLHKADESVYKDALKIIYEEFSLYKDLTKDDVEKIVLREK